HTRFSRDWSSDVCSSDLARWLDERRGEPAAASDLLGSAARAGVLRIHPAQERRGLWRGELQGAVREPRTRPDPPRRALGRALTRSEERRLGKEPTRRPAA